MKAEHRKDLETNLLADRVGNAYQSLRRKPDRRALLYGLGALVLLLAVIFVYRNRSMQQSERSELWTRLEDGSHRNLSSLYREAPDTPAGKAARLQAAWIIGWEEGFKQLGQKPAEALKALDSIAKFYRDTEPLVAGDPVFEPEMKYMLAVIEETRAIQDRSYLDSAQKRYQELAREHKDSAHGKLAEARAEVLGDAKKRAEIAIFYQDLQAQLGVDRALDLKDKMNKTPAPAAK